ncbi:MarR family winged helix-turn-helix transcriptional regulator [Sphingobium sp.]|uniref:MarR family winged helix-turn-helix transcriptional regulator n=1 Tax=Sphingobium sp. TaxID=1912891 RepID=UPI0028BD985C|nr:MarR family transcriptional regulator [Sphingobium sp.]
MPRRPIDQLKAGRAYYARLLPQVDDAHFGALWHLFTVGHLVTTDLDSIARRYHCSFADLDLLATLGIDEEREMRATDLASTLYLSNAVISTRIARLERNGLVQRRRRKDRRAYALRLTETGRALVEQAIVEIARQAKIARFFRELAPEDQSSLVRILGELHQRFDREFVGGPYQDD